jgi:hypothetical protein
MVIGKARNLDIFSCRAVHEIILLRLLYLIGYNTPENVIHYAHYLDTRIRAYRHLKHDVVRIQSESNRDIRVNNLDEESRPRGHKDGGDRTPQRSKTIAGRKLRVMTVDKGLLRETKVVQTMIEQLTNCKVCGQTSPWALAD